MPHAVRLLRQSFYYDAVGNLVEKTLSTGLSLQYAYNNNGLPESMDYYLNNDLMACFDYIYDALGRVTHMADMDGTHDYSYDIYGNLYAANHSSPSMPDEYYTYDLAGNRTSSHLSAFYCYNEMNTLLADEHFTYTYNDQGGLIAKSCTDPPSPYMILERDNLNRATDMEYYYSSNASIPMSRHTYDYLGRSKRIKKILQKVCYTLWEAT